MVRYNPRRIEAVDRRLAAIHEAGHCIVTQWLGCSVIHCYIRPSELTAAEWTHDKMWLGRTCANLKDAKPGQRRKIALAGALAELGWMGSEGCSSGEMLQDPFFMSPSDWSLAGCEPGEPTAALERDFGRVQPMLIRGGKLWPDLLETARELIVESRDQGF